MTSRRLALAAALAAGAAASHAHAVLVTFTGGTVTFQDTTTLVTNGTTSNGNAAFYDEGGYRFSFLPALLSPSSAFVGTYYGGNNDVIHAHWDTGGIGQVNLMEITQLAPGTFDLNYFTLTSNSQIGGGPATGLEETWVQGYLGGFPTGPAVLLPVEDWGFPATQVGLGPDFDAVDSVRFFVTNQVACFGMDDFYINEIPAPSTLAIGALFGGLALRRRR